MTFRIIFYILKQFKDFTPSFSSDLKNKQIIVLGILDNYDYMQPELIEILEQRLPQFLDIQKPKFKMK